MITIGIVDNDRFALPMLDMPLTDIPGPEICRRVRAASADIVVLGITSYSLDHYRQLAIDAGSQGLIAKSVTPKELAEAMRNVLVLPFPGFPTDMQAQIMVLSALADGSSVITENIFENRFMFASELVRMGADIRIESHHAMIHGVKGFSGAQVTSPDLRGGAALVVAGLIADGVTEVSAIHHIKRGYEQFVEKLQALGAHVEHATVPDPVIY